MAMYFDDSIPYDTLRLHFNAAQRSGVRYLGVLQQILDDPYAVTCDQRVISAHDCTDIVRQVREAGLRPGAPQTTLFRLLDTRGDFHKQADLPAAQSLAQNFTDEARVAYQRYIDQRAQNDQPANKSGFISRLFGR